MISNYSELRTVSKVPIIIQKSETLNTIRFKLSQGLQKEK